jgi:hypothetical protein
MVGGDGRANRLDELVIISVAIVCVFVMVLVSRISCEALMHAVAPPSIADAESKTSTE